MIHSPEISQVGLILDVQFQDFGVLCDCVRCVHPPTSKVTRLSVSKNRNQDKLSDLHQRDWLRNFSPYLWLTMPSEMTYCTNYAPTGTIPSCTLWFMYSWQYLKPEVADDIIYSARIQIHVILHMSTQCVREGVHCGTAMETLPDRVPVIPVENCPNPIIEENATQLIPTVNVDLPVL